jgi:hypothetical protein
LPNRDLEAIADYIHRLCFDGSNAHHRSRWDELKGRVSMSATRIATCALVGLVAIHGYIFFRNGEVHPCNAASKRMQEEYQFSSEGLGMEIQRTDFSGSGYVSAHEVLLRIFPREVVFKLETAERWGMLGCYVTAVLGWRVIPPIASSKSNLGSF